MAKNKETNINVLSDRFNLYMQKGKDAKAKGNFSLARRNFLLASEVMMQMAQLSSGSLKEVRMERARKLVTIADNLGKEKVTSEKPKNETSQEEEDDEKKWQAAQIPSISFADVAGLDDVKQVVKVKMINPSKYPEKYKIYAKKTGGGVLLYGPPGTGKTMIAKAIACEVGAKFYAVKGSDIVSKWVGESEKNINSLFAEANKQDKAIIFIDEMDSLFGKRGVDTHNDKRVNEFLQQIDGFSGQNPNLMLLGATNRPWDVDPAVMRSGRFSVKIYIPMPDAPARRFMIEKAMKGVPVSKDFDVEKIVEKTQGYSGSDIEELCDRAKDEPLMKSIETDTLVLVTNKNFDDVLEKFPPSVTKKEIEKFEKYNEELSER